MPSLRPSTSGYARIVEAEEEDEEEEYEEDDHLNPKSTLFGSQTQYAPIQPGRLPRMHSYQGATSKRTSEDYKPGRGHRRNRSSSTVDIKAINARLERWAEEIASKFKIRRTKGKSLEEEKLEIYYSVFQAPEDIRPANAETLVERLGDEADIRMTKVQFDDIVESVKVAMELGTQPKMITQGSSGSYFARDSHGKVVGVFKPKDEEPYASKNPKWTKWAHRQFSWLIPFGRACLIPNLSYVSEAAAYVLDARLQTNIVPYTDIVYLSSPSFNYDYWDRRAYYRKHKPLPPKVGSFQVFLKGFQDATIFLKQHPWPDQTSTASRSNMRAPKRGRTYDCRTAQESSDEEEYEVQVLSSKSQSRRRRFWTNALQLSFREELEKLVILDYIMRNTDRGLDNWMIRIDEDTQQATLVAEPPRRANGPAHDGGSQEPYQREEPMIASGSSTPRAPTSTVRLGAIDNSLSWPWKHPDGWRSFPFGWLFLPVSLIGQPFTERTRQHFLPLLTSKQWWSETQVALRKCFMQDADFQEKMFAKQIAVMKGQAWNVVETLKIHDHGPLELTRRTRVMVWDDLVDIPVAQPMRPSTDETRRALKINGASNASEQYSDLGAAQSSAPQPAHLALTPSLLDSAQAGPNRFNTSRQSSPEQVKRDSEDGDISLHPAVSTNHSSGLAAAKAKSVEQFKRPRPDTRNSRARLSYDEPRSRWLDDDRKRTHSFTLRRLIDENEEDDGDLGFAAAAEQEGKTKKVIVERLETVKSNNPVFTWC